MDVSQSAAVVLNSGILNSSREVKTETLWEPQPCLILKSTFGAVCM